MIESPCPGPRCAAKLQAPQERGHRVVYLVFDGITLTRSSFNEDARENVSAIVNSSTEQIPPFDHHDLADAAGMDRQEVIDQITSYLETVMSPYDVELTTTRPLTGNYHMIVFGGDAGSVLGVSGGILGVSILDCGDIMPNNIVFVFTGVTELELDIHTTGATAAHEIGHSLGLSHIAPPTAIMYWLVTSTQADAYHNAVVDTYDPNQPNLEACDHTDHQNSHQLILDTVGPRGQDVVGPSVAIDAPMDGGVLRRGDTVQAAANDPSGVDFLELQLGGLTVGEDRTAPYTWTVPDGAASGEQQLRIRAQDGLGNASTTEIKVYVLSGEEQPCADGEPCDEGWACGAEQICLPEGLADGVLGAPCQEDGECASGFCFELLGDRRCSRPCEEAAPCPQSFECVAGAACRPSEDSGGTGGGGCALTRARDDVTSALWILLIALGLLRRKHRANEARYL